MGFEPTTLRDLVGCSTTELLETLVKVVDFIIPFITFTKAANATTRNKPNCSKNEYSRVLSSSLAKELALTNFPS